jgi:hypothetical protein
VVDFLEEEALLDRKKPGPITAVRWRPMIERWSKDYGFDRADVVRGYIAPRGVERTIESLRRFHTADVCRHRIRRRTVRRPVRARTPPDRLRRRPGRGRAALDLRPTDRGANVVLAANTDDFAFERARDIDGLRVAAVSQVAVDLMTGPGRNPAEAEALLDWMEENEDVWRR